MRRLYSAFSTLVRGGTGIAFMVLAAAVLIQVVTRTFLTYSPVWTEELSRFALMYLIALGVGLSIRSGDLVNVDLFLHILPKKSQRVLETIAFLAVAGLGVIILLPTLEFMAVGELQTSPALGWRMDYIFFAMPIVAVMLIVFGLERALRVIGRENRQSDISDATRP